jgi:Na+/melibiose symporter-like transporter
LVVSLEDTLTPRFFVSVGLGQQSFQYGILIAVAGLFGCLIAVGVSDIVGRRFLCILGAALATMFAALIGSIGPMSNRTASQNNVVIASVILLNGVCKLGVASQCWLIGSEIGGIQMRKRMIGWATVIDVLAAFLVTFCTPYLQAGPQIQLGARVGYVFMALAAIAVIYFFLFVPELKGRSLEEVDELYEVSPQSTGKRRRLT